MTRDVSTDTVVSIELAGAEQNRLPGLDGIRAIAVATLIIFHLSLNGPAKVGFLHAFLREGGFGVQLFFGVSGLLITWLLLREEEGRGRISLGYFYARRAIRILPPAFVYLAVVYAVGVWRGNASPGDIFASAFFYRNLTDGGSVDTAHFWTLAVEEQFYLLWPIVFMLIPRSRRVAVLLAAFLAVPIWRQVNTLFFPVYHPLRGDLQCDYLIAGCLLACLLRDERFRRATGARLARSDLLAVGAALVIAATFVPREIGRPAIVEIFYTPLRAICVAAILHRVIQRSMRPTWIDQLLNATPLVVIGQLSYSLYLWQQPFCMPTGTWRTSSRALDVLAAVGCAIASCSLVELPAQKLRRRLSPRAARAISQDESRSPSNLT